MIKVIDYLYLFKNYSCPDWEHMAELSEELMAIAKKYNVAFITPAE